MYDFWSNCRNKYTEHAYALFRVLVGLAFMQHGLQKVFGLLGKAPAEPFTLIWIAGVIELIGGFLVVIGLFTVLASGINALLMFVAYWYAHGLGALTPIANRGELAVIYFAAFLFITVYGGGKYSVDGK